MKLYGFEFLEEYRPVASHVPKEWAQAPAIPEVFYRPQSFLQKAPLLVNVPRGKKAKLLLLGGESVSLGYLAMKLKAHGFPFISINLDEFVFAGGISFDPKKGLSLKYGKQTLNLNSVEKVFFQTPQFLMGIDAHPEILTSEEKVFLSRWRTMVHDLPQMLGKATWFPAKPTELYESSQQKFSDLILAKELGLQTPDTLVTMEPKDAKAFVKKHKGRVLFREFSVRRIHRKDKLNTFKVDFVKASSKDWKQIAASPTVFQQYVEKKSEFRAVVVGRRLFACEIESQKGDRSKLDWRHYEFDKVAFKKASLPASLEKKLLDFAKARGFAMCSFDLVQSTNGDIYFLEMNRPGAWLFVESLTGLSITNAILNQLRTP